MRLLNTETFQLEEVLDETVKEYAILSHTWGLSEVLFTDIHSLEQASTKSGFAKLKGFCRTAAAAGYTYGWIDTCCIDKSSLTELSEAINSMFRWYRQASVCYVYLSDFQANKPDSSFTDSKWFTRGWTLQELLAPTYVEFFDVDWVKLGIKEDLVEPIHQATGIDESAIKQLDIYKFCAAEKMSWAANRVTTRPEDVAYSLLGLFDVAMPMLYGEGQNAFLRLQEHIIKGSNDRSIFAWRGTDKLYTGALAKTPAFFGTTISSKTWFSQGSQIASSYTLTNCGLEIELCLWPIAYKTYQASIAWSTDVKISSQKTCFFLRWLPVTRQYVRTQYLDKQVIDGKDSSTTDVVNLSARQQQISRPCVTGRVMILDRLSYADYPRLYDVFNRSPQRTPRVRLGMMASGDGPKLGLVHIHTVGKWNAKRKLLRLGDDFFGTAAIFTFDQLGTFGSMRTDSPRKLLIGYDFHFFPVCVIMTSGGCGTTRKLSNTTYQPRFSDDISKKCIEDITCLETKGWSRSSGDVVDEVEGRRGVWAFKHNSYEVMNKTFGKNGNWSIRIALEIDEDWEWNVTIGENEDSKPSRTWRPQYVPDHLRVGKMARALRRASIDRNSGDEKEENEEDQSSLTEDRQTGESDVVVLRL